jgi:hypothetical protein
MWLRQAIIESNGAMQARFDFRKWQLKPRANAKALLSLDCPLPYIEVSNRPQQFGCTFG